MSITSLPDKVQYMLDIFNNYDDNLKFTYEIENNHEISFLDVYYSFVIKK